MSNSQNEGVGLQFHYHAAGAVREIAHRIELAGYPGTARDIISTLQVAIGNGTQREKAILTMVAMIRPDALAQLDTLIGASDKDKESQRLHVNGSTPRLTEIFSRIDEILKESERELRSELIQVVDRSAQKAPQVGASTEPDVQRISQSGAAISGIIRDLGPSPTGSQGKRKQVG